jgi:hypothetical protein
LYWISLYGILEEYGMKVFLARVLVETFNDVQEAWSDYREHLTEHGLLLSTK